MVDHLKLKSPVKERPLSDWSTIAVEYLGATNEIIEGKRWHHRVIHKGDGPPLLMYHGIGGHAETYARTLPAIAAAGYHVYAVDALFHGYSSKDGFPFEDRTKMIEIQAQGVVDLIEALGYDKVHYEGESMGAAIGFEFGLNYPEYANKVILNGFGSVKLDKTFPPSKGSSMADLFPLSVAAVTDPSYDKIAKRLHWLVHPEHPDRITDEMVRVRQRLYQDPEINASMRNVFNVDGGGTPNFEPKYTEADCRERWKPEALVLWGEFNPGQGPDYGAYASELINAKFYEFKDAGHWPQWEMPDEYARVIIEYLNG